MTITITLPQAIERELRQGVPNLEQVALENIVIGLYTNGNLSLGDIANIMELQSRQEANDWLVTRKVPLNYSLVDLEADRVILSKFFPEIE